MTEATKAPDVVVLEATDLEHGRAEAAAKLGVPPDQVTLRVLSQRRSGFLGLGKTVLQLEATRAAAATDGASSAGAAGKQTGNGRAAPAVPDPSQATGRIELTCSRGRISLAVFQPVGYGRRANEGMLNTLIEGWPLSARDETAAMAALRAADGKPRVFATMVPSKAVAEDAPAAVKISSDGRRAWLIPWAPVAAEKDTLLAILADAGVTAGVDQAALDALHGTQLTTIVEIARSRTVRHGVDARVEWVDRLLVDVGALTLRDDGTIDLECLLQVPAVQPGDVLARKIRGVPPEDGYTVRGENFPANPARDVDLSRFTDRGTTVSDDGSAIVAQIAGIAGQQGSRLGILPVTVIAGDLTPEAGEVDAQVDLLVKGSIRAGSAARARGNILVTGDVEAAQVTAGGEVRVQGKIVGLGGGAAGGQHPGTITAGRAVIAKEVNPGTTLSIGGAMQLVTAKTAAGTWQAADGKVQFTPAEQPKPDQPGQQRPPGRPR